MKRLFLSALVWGIGMAGVWAQATWGTDSAAALAAAKEQNRPVLIDFTGSDWCGWCMKFDKEVLSTPAFLSYARDNLILLKADFPRNHPQPPEVAEQNKALKRQYEVKGFPTLVLVSPEGKELKRFGGYQKGGPAPFIAQLKQASPAAAPAETAETAVQSPVEEKPVQE